MELYVLVSDAARCKDGGRWAFAGKVMATKAWDLAAPGMGHGPGAGSFVEWELRPGFSMEPRTVLARFLGALSRNPGNAGWVQVREGPLDVWRTLRVELRSASPKKGGRLRLEPDLVATFRILPGDRP